MSFQDKKKEVSLKLLETIEAALDEPQSKDPEYLALLAQAFAHVAEHGRGEREPRQPIRKLN